MQCIPVQTRKILPPKDDLYEIFDKFLPKLQEKDILLVSSKVTGIHQGRCIKRDIADKGAIARKEAQYVLEGSNPLITIINNAIGFTSGIDPHSGHYVLLPENPNKLAEEFRSWLCNKYSLNNLGVIISDSRSQPLRRGLMCYSVGFAGICPLSDESELKNFSRWTTNVVDSLTAYVGLYLGESSQKHKYTPMVIIRGADKVNFTDKRIDEKFYVDGDEDLYYPLYKQFNRKTP